MERGVLQGKYLQYYDNGQIAESINYEEGKMHGEKLVF